MNLKARCPWECDCLHFYWLVLDLLVHVLPKPRKTDVARVVHEWSLCHKAACVALCPLNCYCFACENKIVFSDRVSRKVLRASRSSIIDSRFSLPEPLLSIVEDRDCQRTVERHCSSWRFSAVYALMADGWMDWLIEWLVDWFVGGFRGMSPEGLVLYLTPA